MSGRRHIATSEVGDVTIVKFTDAKIIDTGEITDMGDQLFELVEKDNRKNLLLNFENVQFLSSAALNKLIILDKKVKAASGKLKVSNLKPEIVEVFVITRLNLLFEILSEEAEAIKTF